MIEDHAEQLTSGLIVDLKRNPRTAGYHDLTDAEIHDRVYNVYHDLGSWLSGDSEKLVEAHYTNLGTHRAKESVPLSQVLYALIRTKAHLFEYVRREGLFDSVVDLYQHQEFRRLVDIFFDKAIYYTARAYETEQARHSVPAMAG
jgi:hypothetical protein